MTSLLGSLGQFLTPDVVGALGRAVGQDTTLVQKGLDVVGPLVLGSLAKKSETTSGLDSIMRLLPQDGGAGFLGNVAGALGQQDPLSSAGLLNGVLGPGISAIGKTLSGRLGFDVAPLLAAAAPTILNVISKMAKEQKLNSADLARTLQAERTATMAGAKPEVQAMVNEAMHIGDRAERLRSTFTDDEWTKIRLAPLAATYYVMGASASGVVGTTKEVLAAGDAMKTLVKDALPSSLVDVAFGSLGGKLEAGTALEERSPRPSLDDRASGCDGGRESQEPGRRQVLWRHARGVEPESGRGVQRGWLPGHRRHAGEQGGRAGDRRDRGRRRLTPGGRWDHGAAPRVPAASTAPCEPHPVGRGHREPSLS